MRGWSWVLFKNTYMTVLGWIRGVGVGGDYVRCVSLASGRHIWNEVFRLLLEYCSCLIQEQKCCNWLRISLNICLLWGEACVCWGEGDCYWWSILFWHWSIILNPALFGPHLPAATGDRRAVSPHIPSTEYRSKYSSMHLTGSSQFNTHCSWQIFTHR